MPIQDYEFELELDPEPDPKLEPESESDEVEEVVPIYNPPEVIVIESDTEDESMEGDTEENTGDIGATFEGWDVRNGLQIGYFVYVRLDPLGGCAWKAESWVGTYIGPIQILGQKTPWVYQLGPFPNGFTNKVGDLFDFWSLQCIMPDPRKIVRRDGSVDFRDWRTYREELVLLLGHHVCETAIFVRMLWQFMGLFQATWESKALVWRDFPWLF
ncbi:unnamed protein product [Camellia sinensis]